MKWLFAPATRLALVFLIFGILWIVFSDNLLYNAAKNNLEVYDRLQTWKGLLFVVFSSVLVYIVGGRLFRSIEKANGQKDEALLRFNILGMATNDAVWDLNLLSNECYTNRTLQEMFGYTADELSDNNKWWRDNLHPSDKDRVLETIDAKLNTGGTVWQDEYRFRCKNGSYKTVFDRGYILRNKAGRPYRIIGAMQDVTEQRQLQKQVIEQQIRYKVDLAAEVIRAQEAERKKLGEELHDNVNQLLGVVKLYVEHAQVNATERETLLKKSVDYLMMVIEEIRNLSKSLVGPSIHESGLTGSLVSLARTVTESGKIEMETRFDDVDEQILTDLQKLMLYRIVQEQVNNIMKHSNATKASLTLTKNGNHIVLEIRDNGKGFDPTTNKQGLGFKNIRNRVAVFDGHLEIKSAKEEGCLVKIQFQIDVTANHN
jgi:two-component system sensor histidine kinase UhpB